MIWISFIWFSLLYGAGYYFSPNKDMFGPVRFATLKIAVFNLPFILYTALYPDSFLKGILTVCHTNVYDAFYKYTLVQTLAYVSLLAGILLFNNGCTVKDLVLKRIDTVRLKVYTVVLALMALTAYGVFLLRIGGLSYLLNNLHNRVALQGGQYILILLELLPVVVLLQLIIYRKQPRKSYLWLIALSLFLFSFIYSSFGGRKPTMILVATALIGWHYYIGRIVFSKKIIAYGGVVAVLFAFYLLLVPYIRLTGRQDESAEKYVERGFTVKAFMYNLSYTYIDVFVSNYFTPGNSWRMEGYFDSVKSFAYKGDKGNVPQVDQGVYLKSIYLYQKDFRPPMPRKSVSATSWPTENLGFTMANFGWYGVLPSFLLLGVAYSFVYRFVSKYFMNPVALLFYVQVIIQFNFSSLRLSFFVKTLLLFYLCSVVFNKFVLPKNQNEG